LQGRKKLIFITHYAKAGFTFNFIEWLHIIYKAIIPLNENIYGKTGHRSLLKKKGGLGYVL